MPTGDAPLVVEGAGGVLVPLRQDLLFADVFARWGLPVVLVARTSLGTINHTLLSIEALRARGMVVAGVAFVGDANEETRASDLRDFWRGAARPLAVAGAAERCDPARRHSRRFRLVGA